HVERLDQVARCGDRGGVLSCDGRARRDCGTAEDPEQGTITERRRHPAVAPQLRRVGRGYLDGRGGSRRSGRRSEPGEQGRLARCEEERNEQEREGSPPATQVEVAGTG